LRKKLIFLLTTLLLITITACHNNEDEPRDVESVTTEAEPESDPDIEAEPADIEFTDYAEEVGFDMKAPLGEVATTFSLKGSVEKVNELQEDHLWIIIRKSESIEEIDSREMEHYVTLETDGSFDADLNLHHGEGEYRVTVRVPDTEKDNYYYDAAIFRIDNLDDNIARDVELTKFGIEKDLQFNEPIKGWNEASEFFEIEGTVGANYNNPTVIAEVRKDGEENQIAIPLENGSFKGDVPLYFGEGTHEIRVNLYMDDDDNKYYHSATLYVHNDSNKTFPEITQYGPYIDRGLTLEYPSWTIDTELDSIEYPVKGTINPDAPLAHTASHIIVEIRHMDDRKDKATYYFPVVNNRFEGTAHFRFGPGDYKVTIYVPNEEQKKSNEIHFTSALEINHTVNNIEDQRDLLPSRGIESDSPEIFEKAKEITKGLKTEREQAKAIYEFVSKNVSYDVEKFREDIFHPDDSAIETLEAGTGICQDYAFLTIALLRSIDIESRYVSGYAGGRHAWVEAKVDGDWIEMDPTWGAGYVDGDDFHFKYREDYFDPDPDFLDKTHTRYDLLY